MLAPETVDLEISSHTVAGDYPDAPDGVVVWANNVTTTPVGWDEPFQQSRELTPFDEVSGAAVDYDVGFEEVENDEGEIEQVDVTREGQIYKFPFNTEKKDYHAVGRSELGEATDRDVRGRGGARGHHGLQVRADHRAHRDRHPSTSPARSSASDEPTVEADMVYAMTRTFYVEPTTGAPLNRVEERNQVLSYDGTERARLRRHRAVHRGVAGRQHSTRSQTRATLLRLAEWVFPIGLVLLGLLLLGRRVLLRAAGDGRRTTRHEHKHAWSTPDGWGRPSSVDDLGSSSRSRPSPSHSARPGRAG